MKGKILDFNTQTNQGIISGNDGNRYEFSTFEWKSEKSPSVNKMVDFEVDGTTATAIYLDSTVSSQKNKMVAGLLSLFIGAFGIHKFYLGCTTAGIVMLVVFLFGFILLGIPSFIIGAIAFIEAILYFIKTDDEFEEKYVSNKRCWF